ncbi:MAG: hypothetical protein CM15mP49_27260 [Actinomycetota bacterium]|nr:MAG: hypothetical protein CM15mP49_27260 [Actinomycetota bacterium]
MVSAVKVQGKRLYEIAREGKEITREPRTVKYTNYQYLMDLEIMYSR